MLQAPTIGEGGPPRSSMIVLHLLVTRSRMYGSVSELLGKFPWTIPAALLGDIVQEFGPEMSPMHCLGPGLGPKACKHQAPPHAVWLGDPGEMQCFGNVE